MKFVGIFAARVANCLIIACLNSKLAMAPLRQGSPVCSRFLDPYYFRTRSINWTPDGAAAKQLPKVEVPVGFVTDFASIPRIFWSLLKPDGEYAWAAGIHYYLYWEQPLNREKADEIFKLAMLDTKIDASTVQIIYRAVRLGGGSAWTENGTAKAKGEKRILKTFPSDPTTSWSDWKKKPRVFAP